MTNPKALQSAERLFEGFSAFSDRLWASDVSRRFQGSDTVPKFMTTKQWQVVHKFFDFYVENALLGMNDVKRDPLQDRHSVINTLAS